MHNVQLQSTVLIEAIYGVDSHIMQLQDKVLQQKAEIQALRKDISDRNNTLFQDSQAKVGRTLSLLLNPTKPPTNDDMGLATVLILKHLESVISRARNGMTTYDCAIFEIEHYINVALNNAEVCNE